MATEGSRKKKEHVCLAYSIIGRKLEFGQQESRYPGQAALFNDTVDGLIIFWNDGGATFDVSSIDIDPLNSPAAVSVSFRGYLGGMEVANQTFVHSGNAISLETFNFNSDFLGIDRLEWNQTASFHQFIILTLLPGPGAIALLGLGCLAPPADDASNAREGSAGSRPRDCFGCEPSASTAATQTFAGNGTGDDMGAEQSLMPSPVFFQSCGRK